MAGTALLAWALLLTAGTAFAQTPANAEGGRGWGGQGGSRTGTMHMMPGVFGTVSAISGTTLTITSKGFGPAASASATVKTYTVDASNATVMKDNATSTLGSVSVGDMVAAQGTVSGTSVTATVIRDGFVPCGMGGMNGMKPGEHASSTAPIVQGNGQPVVGGTVSAVSGNTVTITTAQGNQTYTVDVTNAGITKGKTASSVAGIAVGDKVVVQGTVSGNSVTASSVMDNGASSGAKATMGAAVGGISKVFGSIGGFFHNLFGFF